MNNYQLSINNYQLPKGYKQTEVGVIPEDWKTCPLGEAVEFLDGKRKPIKESDRAKMRGIYPYYGASGIVDYVNDYLFNEDLILLGEDGENILSRSVRLAFRASGKIWVNNHAHVLRPNSEFDIDFLSEYLESLDYSLYNSGTAQPKLNQQTCQRILVVQPSKKEQRAIAATLSDVDALIASLDKLIAKQRHLKTATMQQLLTGKKRLPGFGEGKGYKQTEVGLIPKDWDILEVRDIVESNRLPSGIYKEKSLYGEGKKIIKISDVFNLDYFNSAEAQRVQLEQDEIVKYQVKTGDIFIALASVKLEGVGKVMLVAELEEETAFDHNVALIRLNSFGDPKFIFYLLKSDFVRNKVGKTATQVGTTFLKASTILAFQLPIPRIEEQRAIATVLSDIDAAISALETRRAKTQAIKQGMMQELLTGRTRLV